MNTSSHPTKYRSNWFRVATEGATSDGRIIERRWIEQMAQRYNRSVYGARVWLEHFRGMLPDSPFKAYGDVLAIKAEEVEMEGSKRLALFAQIEPTDELIAIVKARQKIYTSIEVDERFANGGAYLVGLAVTDSPASLGTEMLTFCAQNPALKLLSNRKEKPDNLLSESIETAITFEAVDDTTSLFKVLSDKITALLSAAAPPAAPVTVDPATEPLAELFQHHLEALEPLFAQSAQIESLQRHVATLRTELNDITEHLSTTPSTPNRPLITGGADRMKTDC
jgi:hypothetical protein